MLAVFRDYFHFHHGDIYEVETVEYCDDALSVLLRRAFNVAVRVIPRLWRRPTSQRRPASAQATAEPRETPR